MDRKNIVFGAAKLDNLNLNTANELLSRIYDLGIREIDTAPSYSDSELFLGRNIHQFPDIKINTKVGLNGESKITPTSIRKSVNKSLERLQIPKINTLFVHSVPSHLLNEEVFTTLEDLKRDNLCDAIAYSGDGQNLQNLINNRSLKFDTFMFSYNFLDQSNKKIMSRYESNSRLYLKRVLGNSVWRKRTTKDVVKDLLGRSRGHDEYRERMSQLYPRGIKNGYAASLDFVRYEFPLAKYVLGISNLKQCKDLNRYLGNLSVPDRTLMELRKQVYQDRASEVEFPPIT